LFNLLIKKYRIHPKFSLGIRNTADWVSYKTTKVYTVHDEIDYSVSYNQNIEGIFEGFGLMYYGWAEYEFFSDISLNGELIFKWTKFVRELTRPSVFELQFSESDSYIEIPIYLKKYFHIDKNTLPYIAAGIGWLYLTKADANATIIYTDDGTSESTGNISMLGLRNRNTFEWIAGAGIGYKHKNLRLFLDARYYCGINSFTNPEKGLSDNVLVNDFYYIDNNVKLNQFEIGASISYTLINSVKRVRH